MSELHHWYDRAAVSGQITQPPFAELAQRGRRRAHRVRAARAAMVAGFAALAVAPLLIAPEENPPGTPAAAPPSTRAWEWYEIHVSFLDPDHGAASYAGDACGEGWVAVTQDGGATWTELRELPMFRDQDRGTDAGDEPACIWPLVIPTAPNTLLMVGPPPPSVLPDWPSFISHDAGQTWREYQPQVRTADSVPDGVVPFWPCDEQVCKEAGLGWYDPLTGDWMVLRNNPPPGADLGVTVGFDGSIWAYGSGNDGELPVAVSHDQGRTWLDRSPSDVDVEWLSDAVLTPYDGDTAYLHPADLSEEPEPPVPFDLLRTTDGGESWHQVPGAQRFEDVVGVWTDRDGGLVVVDLDTYLSGYQYRSQDGGETFSRTELPVSLPLSLPGVLWGQPSNRSAAASADFYISEDGITWHPVEVPHYPGRYGDPTAFPSPSFPFPTASG